MPTLLIDTLRSISHLKTSLVLPFNDQDVGSAPGFVPIAVNWGDHCGDIFLRVRDASFGFCEEGLANACFDSVDCKHAHSDYWPPFITLFGCLTYTNG
jgi:hypothetical protein